MTVYIGTDLFSYGDEHGRKPDSEKDPTPDGSSPDDRAGNYRQELAKEARHGAARQRGCYPFIPR